MRRHWTAGEEAQLACQYPHMATAVIAAMFDRPLPHIYAKAQQMSLRKTAEYLASPAACRLRRDHDGGIAHRFPKGHVPANKGLRRPGWYRGRMRETQFKPGVRQGIAVKLYKPIGTERISKDGYRERKVNDDLPLQRRWKAVHRIVWEAENGPVPRGYIVAFKDGDKLNITLDNLELRSLVDNMLRNTIHARYPKVVREVMQLAGALKRQINKRTRA